MNRRELLRRAGALVTALFAKRPFDWYRDALPVPDGATVLHAGPYRYDVLYGSATVNPKLAWRVIGEDDPEAGIYRAANECLNRSEEIRTPFHRDAFSLDMEPLETTAEAIERRARALR